jgi:two-component sensor histidine kinase
MLVPVIVFFVFAEVAGLMRYFQGWRGIAVASMPILAGVSLLTNDLHSRYFSDYAVVDKGTHLKFTFTPGPHELINTVYIYVLMIASIAMLIYALQRQPKSLRNQLYFLAPAILIPVIVDITYLFKFIDWGPIYPTPYAIFLSVILFGIALIRYRFMDIIPIAQGELFNGIQDAIIVVDNEGNLAAYNPSASRLFSFLSTKNLGVPLDSLLPPELHPLLTGVDKSFMEFENPGSPKEKFYDVTTSTLNRPNGVTSGRVLTFRNISQRKAMEKNLEETLREKDVLFREVHHRVKNNFNLVISLLSLEAAQFEDERIKKAFADSQNRINSMARIHEALYRSTDVLELKLDGYLETIARDLLVAVTKENEVELHLELEAVKMGIEQAIPCGLILNELITNTLKYAFESEAESRQLSRIAIALTQPSELEICLEVSDNGRGLPQDALKGDTLGMQLVHLLVNDQLSGSLKIDSSQGTRYRIEFQRSSPLT